MSLNEYFVDLHIHIGSTIYGKPVKITASRSLTLTNILKEASERKGLDMVGIIDAHVPAVQEELEKLITNGQAKELEGGGVAYENVTLILGSEIEVYDENCKGPIHVLCYLPTLANMKMFSEWFDERVSNLNLSSQRMYGSAVELQEKVKELDGLFIPAHIFTPFKSLYGKGVEKSLREILKPDLIDAVELGLSSDTFMADQIAELHDYTFLTNSDAHSLKKIAREYQKINMSEPTFHELKMALEKKDGREVVSNYGMNPVLGKYHTTVCANCFESTPFGDRCEYCGHNMIVKGVSERINELASEGSTPPKRPPYIHQAPLEYLPSLGPKTYEKMLSDIGTEMYILHTATEQELRQVCSNKLVNMILEMRQGKLSFLAGGGGKYGKVQDTSKK
jgi:uncharacterized protein (TIGR00375 family)